MPAPFLDEGEADENISDESRPGMFSRNQGNQDRSSVFEG